MASDWKFDFEEARGSLQGRFDPEWGGRSPAPGSDSPGIVSLREGGSGEAHLETNNPKSDFNLRSR